MTLIEERLAEINTIMSTLRVRVDDMDKFIEKARVIEGNGRALRGDASGNELLGS